MVQDDCLSASHLSCVHPAERRKEQEKEAKGMGQQSFKEVFPEATRGHREVAQREEAQQDSSRVHPLLEYSRVAVYSLSLSLGCNSFLEESRAQ